MKVKDMLELNKLLQDATTNLEEPYDSKVLKMVDKIVSRETPKQVNGDIRDWGCPKCDATIEYEYQYCPYCGQRLYGYNN